MLSLLDADQLGDLSQENKRYSVMECFDKQYNYGHGRYVLRYHAPNESYSVIHGEHKYYSMPSTHPTSETIDEAWSHLPERIQEFRAQYPDTGIYD